MMFWRGRETFFGGPGSHNQGSVFACAPAPRDLPSGPYVMVRVRALLVPPLVQPT